MVSASNPATDSTLMRPQALAAADRGDGVSHHQFIQSGAADTLHGLAGQHRMVVM